jgi:hypothetical protein
MELLIDDPKATDPAYINLQKDLFWLDPPDLARQHVEELYACTKDILDKKFVEKCKRSFHSCYAEMYFAAAFRTRCGITVTHPSDQGPDFFLNNINAWAEVIAPTDGEPGNPNTVPNQVNGVSRSYPEDKVILRLCNAFETKAQKMRKDINKSIVDTCQPIVICISGGGMNERIPMYPVGGYPQIVKALLPVGDLIFWMNRETREVMSKEYKYREGVDKTTGDGNIIISTEPFLNEEYSHISAVVYSWANAGNPIERKKWGSDFFVLHNPRAINPLPRGFVNCGQEYNVAVADDSFTMEPVINYEMS